MKSDIGIEVFTNWHLPVLPYLRRRENCSSHIDLTPYAPEHGGYVINRWRANALGLTELINKQPDLLHEIIDDHVNLD